MGLEFDWTVRQQTQTPRDFLNTKLSDGTKAPRPLLLVCSCGLKPGTGANAGTENQRLNSWTLYQGSEPHFLLRQMVVDGCGRSIETFT